MRVTCRVLPGLFVLGGLLGVEPGSAQCLQQKLEVASEYLGNEYGRSVALEGDLLVLGAPEHSEGFGQPKTGAAFVFTRSGGDWIETAKLLPNDGANALHFGWSVALAGERIVVGAPWDPLNTQQSFPPGAAYVFERTGASWLQTAKLQGSGAPANCMVGWSVVADGDVIAIGGPLHDGPGGSAAGRAWVFERTQQGWSETANIAPPWAAGWFGSDLALQGGTLLTGAPGGATGRVLVVQRSGGTWVATQELQPSAAQSWDRFGGALALDGDTAVCGAAQHDTAVVDAGAVYAFERVGGVWLQAAELLAGDGQQNDLFGHSVSLEQDRVLIGAPNGGPGGGSARTIVLDDLGSAYLFERSGAQWDETHEFLAPDGELYSAFGLDVALAGDDALILRWFEGSSPPGPGSAYLWSLAGVGCPSLLGLQANVSLSAGGAQTLVLDAGSPHAGQVHLLLGTTAGTGAGVPVGGVVLPLAFDGPGGYMLQTLTHPNVLPLVDSLGLLDAGGRALARFELPPGMPPGLVGLELHHAYLVLDPLLPAAVFASAPVQVSLVP